MLSNLDYEKAREVVLQILTWEKDGADDYGFYDMVIRMNLTSSEKLSVVGKNYITPTKGSFTLQPGIFEVVDVNKTLKIILPSNLLFDFTIDDITMRRTNLTIQTAKNEESKFIGKSFFHTKIGFMQNAYNERSGKSGKIFIKVWINKFHLKSDCLNACILTSIKNLF